MTTVAAFVYSIPAQTVYDFVTSILVAYLVTSATGASSMIQYQVERDEGYLLRHVLLMFTAMYNSILPLYAFTAFRWNLLKQYPDAICYGERNIAGILFRVASGIHMLILVVFAASFLSWYLSSLTGMDWLYRNLPQSVWTDSPTAYLCFSGFEILAMWCNIVFIVVIHYKGQLSFGRSFQSNSFGYGQIMATGFCLQTLLQFGWQLFRMGEFSTRLPNC